MTIIPNVVEMQSKTVRSTRKLSRRNSQTRVGTQGELAMEASRRTFVQFAVTALAAIGVAVAVAQAGRAEEVRAPMAAVGETQPVYSAVGRLHGRRLESALTSPVAGTRRGTGWLLHSGTEPHDTCERTDAISGLRMMCVAW
jgi:hypothetical protein